MRLVLDLQGAQGESRLRGIGRYSLALAQAIIRNAGRHEVILALNGGLADTVEPLRAAFDGLLPQDHIRVWHSPAGIAAARPGNGWLRQAGERLREAFLAGLRPDVLHLSSLFEGLAADAATSIGLLDSGPPAAATLYDLIPLVHRQTYLKQNPTLERWYETRLDHLRRADLWLAISRSSRQEAIDWLGLPEEWVVNISSAIDDRFRPIALPAERRDDLLGRFGLTRPFVMYTGGIDYRKNIDGLIRGFAALPASLRRAHQLAIVCATRPEDRATLERLAAKQGLAADEVVFTGFVSDDDLRALYNLCRAFVFPSWHEGFGLPALEAMACGAAVIAADATSLPEVIGRGDALFAARDDQALAAKLHQVLADEAFRDELRRHGPRQAKGFSWDNCARAALDAFERLHAANMLRDGRATARPPRHEVDLIGNGPRPEERRNGSRPRLAYVSPLPPECSGIADYSAELLPELSRHYQVEVVVHQAEVNDPWVRANCPIRTAEWFDANAERYDRILYHFGNSEFHHHMFGLLERHPGVVMLHDFFLSGVIAHAEWQGWQPHAWSRALYRSHGYPAVKARFEAADAADAVFKYPCNIAVLQEADGVIVHSDFSRRLATQWYGADAAADWALIPHLRVPAVDIDRKAARQALGLAEDDFVVCSFGFLGRIKLNHRLLAAFLASALGKDERCRLVFVGGNNAGAYGADVVDTIRASGCGQRIQITGFASPELYRRYLAAADVAVQLRVQSRGETSGTVLDCMNYGLATVVNAHGAMADLPGDCVRQLADGFDDGELAAALEHLWRHPDARRSLGERARAHIRHHHAPRQIADLYRQAIERFHAAALAPARVMESLAEAEEAPEDDQPWLSLAAHLAGNLPSRLPERQLFVDLSELVQRDAKSGIQRVVRNVVGQLLAEPPAGWRVEPVYATAGQPYRYARRFTLELLGCPEAALVDEPVEIRAGDCFLGLDLQPEIVPAHAAFFARLRRFGGRVYFVVYDLLCLQRPDCFFPGAAENHAAWLETVAQADGAVCISRTVADDLFAWLERGQPERLRPFHIGWCHLGAEIAAWPAGLALPEDLEATLARLNDLQAVLMVGTVEPRKGHAQVLAAFERLWAAGEPVALVIVGRQGWMVEELAERLRRHAEAGRRLWWFEGISDGALAELYEAARGVLVASEGEGFGLPLVEAAQHGRPILARDIPVFREVAGAHASYFPDGAPEALAGRLREWLAAVAVGAAAQSDQMPWQDWRASTRQLMRVLLEERFYKTWMPGSLGKAV